MVTLPPEFLDDLKAASWRCDAIARSEALMGDPDELAKAYEEMAGEIRAARWWLLGLPNPPEPEIPPRQLFPAEVVKPMGERAGSGSRSSLRLPGSHLPAWLSGRR